jgi:hypothetical protein
VHWCAYHPTYVGSINRRTAVQADLDRNLRPCLKDNQIESGWGFDSSGTAPAQQVWDPAFKLQKYQRKKELRFKWVETSLWGLIYYTILGRLYSCLQEKVVYMRSVFCLRLSVYYIVFNMSDTILVWSVLLKTWEGDQFQAIGPQNFCLTLLNDTLEIYQWNFMWHCFKTVV